MIVDQGNMIGNICQVADSRHFIEGTPQGEKPTKAPPPLEAFCTTYKGRAKANHVCHIPANTMILPPEAKLLECHHMANMTPPSRGHTRPYVRQCTHITHWFQVSQHFIKEWEAARMQFHHSYQRASGRMHPSFATMH